MLIFHIIIAIFSFGFIVFFHELFHYIAARALGIKPKEFAIGFGKSLVVYQKKKIYFLPKKGGEGYSLDEISYHIKLLPLGGYVLFERPIKNENGKLEVAGEYLKIHPLKRILIAIAGPVGNLLLAFIILFSMLTPYMSIQNSGKVIYVQKNSKASTIGIKVNDHIISFDNHPVQSLKSVSGYVTSKNNICITWKNSSGMQKKCVDNHKEKIGVTFAMTLWNGIKFTATTYFNILNQYVSSFFNVFLHLHLNDLNGPVGTLDVIQQSVSNSINFFGILMVINIALGAVNLLLPLSITDGGKVVIDIICLIRRKKSIQTKYLDIISFGLIICLFVLTTYLDISRIVERFL